MATNQRPDIQNALDRSAWRRRLVADYTASAERLTNAYQRILPPLREAANGFTDRLNQWADANPDDDLTPERTRGFKQYQDLLARVEAEMRDFAVIVRNEAGNLQDSAAQTGADGALEMAGLFSQGREGIVRAAWNMPAAETLRTAIGYVDSPIFRQKASVFGEKAGQNMADTILTGIAQGKNPQATARIISNWFAIPFSWAVNTTSTVQLWSYRAANHESYRANPDVVESWMWWAVLGDIRTCLSCISQHGSIYPLSKDLNDHHKGRCTPLPIIKGSTWQNEVQSGRDWFEAQPPATQRGYMGGALYNAWAAGAVDWSQMSQIHSDDLYGDMLVEASLVSILGENAPQYYVRNQKAS